MLDEIDLSTKNFVKLNIDRENLQVVDGVLIKYKERRNENVVIPEGVIEIGKYAIEMPFVKTLRLPLSVEIIRERWILTAFSLTTLYIDNPEVYLEVGCLESLKALKEIYIDGQKIDTVVTQDSERVYLEKYVGADKSYKIDGDVDAICAKAFMNNESLEAVEFPPSVKEIGMWAFKGCKALKEVNMGKSSVKSISGCAFERCVALEKVIMPDTLLDISIHAFDGCVSIKELTLPLSVEYITHSIGVFKGWKRNQTIRIPRQFKKSRFLQKWRKGCRAKIIYY